MVTVVNGERIGKIHNDPCSGSPSRRIRREGKKSVRLRRLLRSKNNA